MPTVIGTTPSGGTLVQDENGQQFEVRTGPDGQPQVIPFQSALSMPAMQAPQRFDPSRISSEAGTPAHVFNPALAGNAAPSETPTSSAMPMARGEKITVQPGVPGTEGMLESFDAAQAKQEAGLQASVEIGQKRAAEEFGAIAEAEQQQSQAVARELDRQRYREDRMAEADEQIQGDMDRLAATSIDPNRIFARADTGAQVMAGIAIGLGALGQALLGTAENPAMQAINRAIDRDIDAQKTDFERNRALVSARSTIYGQMLNRFQDERVASEATRAMLLKYAEVRLQKIAASTKNQELAANAMTMSGQLQEAALKSRANIAKEIGTKVSIEREVKPGDISKVSDDIRQTVKDNPQIKEYTEARTSLMEFNAAVKSGLSGIGIISLVARGLKQGSFGPEMLDILKTQGLKDATEDSIRKFIGGYGEGPTVLKIQAFLANKVGTMEKDLEPQFQRLDRMAKQVGEPGLQSFLSVGSSSPLSALTKGRKRVDAAIQR